VVHEQARWRGSLRHQTGTLLERMINVVGDADILTEELLAHAVDQARAFSARAVAAKS